LALGLDHKNAYIYKQSEEKDVLRLAAIFTKNVTHNTMKAIYGEQKFGAYQSALIQVGDILLPQLADFEGPCKTVTPVGLEQAPHARLTRDLARKQIFQNEYGFEMPSFTFHSILGSLDGGEKMSKSADGSFMLTLSETDKTLKKKIGYIFTGGRETKQEQLELGGQPEICRVFDLYKFFFMENEKDLTKRKKECKNGKILCGECKQDLFSRAFVFIEKHQEKKESKFELAEQILEE
ncbi:MAG: tryptophan--tRNA ligase, partial [Candidatus Heimdallarchaeota archaeon]